MKAGLSLKEKERRVSIRILVVDDYPMNRDLLKRILTEPDFSVDEAKDGLEALQKLSQENFDVLLLDVMMPGMDGIEVHRHLREDLGKVDLPVFFITALDPEETINANLGAKTDYIRKPFNKADIRERVKRVAQANGN